MSATPYIPNFSSSGLGYSPTYQAPITSLMPIILTPAESISADSFYRDTVYIDPCDTWAQQVFITAIQDLGAVYPTATGTISVESIFAHTPSGVHATYPPGWIDTSISQHQYEVSTSVDGTSWLSLSVAPTPVTGTLREIVLVPQSSRYIRTVFSTAASDYICGSETVDLTLKLKDYSWYPTGASLPASFNSPTGSISIPIPTPVIPPVTGSVILPVYNTSCLPGVLEQHPSFLPGLFVNDANLPLRGFASTLIEQWPDWIDISPCTTLHRLTRVFGQSLDHFHFTKSIKVHSDSTVQKVSSPQVEYIVKIPKEIYNKQFILTYSSTVLPLVNKEIYYSSLGSCYTVIDDVIHLKNIHRVVSSVSVTGSTLSFPLVNTDNSVYYTDDYYKYLQPHRWNDVEGFTIFLPSGNYSVSSVTDRENLPITVSLTVAGQVYSLTGFPIKDKSFIDYSLQRFGLKYNSYFTEQEKLLSLQYRNQLSQYSVKKKQLYGIGYDLETVQSFIWNSGSFSTTGTVLVSRELEKEYRLEFVDNGTVSSREASYSRVTERVGQSYLSFRNTVNGVIPDNGAVTGYIAEHIILKYDMLSNLYSRNSSVVDNPYVSIVTGFIITTVGDISYSRLFNSSGTPSNLFLDISRSLSHQSSVNYNTSKWSGFSTEQVTDLFTNNLTFYNYHRMED